MRLVAADGEGSESGHRWASLGTFAVGAVSVLWAYLLLRRPLTSDPHGSLSLGWAVLAIAWTLLLRVWRRARRWGWVIVAGAGRAVCVLMLVAP